MTEAATWRELAYTACLLTVLFVVDGIALFALFLCAILLALPLYFKSRDPQPDVQVGGLVVDTFTEAWAVTLLVGVPLTVVTVYGMRRARRRPGRVRPLGARAERAPNCAGPSTSWPSPGPASVDAFEAERRRIERDLHDGAQQHLVLLTMTLAWRDSSWTRRGPGPAQLVDDAHSRPRQALAELRELIRGIHPQVLTDPGWPPRSRELAERARCRSRSTSRCRAAARGGGVRPRTSSCREALTNAARHSGAPAGRSCAPARATARSCVRSPTTGGRRRPGRRHRAARAGRPGRRDGWHAAR